MTSSILSNTQGRNRSLLISGGLALLSIGALISLHGNIDNFGISGIATASRTLNQIMAVVMTSIALIIPLTANLYTPKLVKLYVTHPLIVTGLSIFFSSHILIMSLHFFPPNHRITQYGVYAVSAIYIGVLAGALPYLYGISQFLRPSYFMPMLTRKGITNLRDLGRARKVDQSARNLFETIDVVANIALTGMNRGDRQIVLLSLDSMHALLSDIITSSTCESQAWRASRGYFVPGLALEGQEFLKRELLWPEAYVLAQMLKIMEGATKRQHEILAELASHLVDTAQLAQVLQRRRVVELHIMTFNTLLRDAVEEKDLRRFQNLSYHYRLLIEAFHESPETMHEAAQHLLHYGHSAVRQGMNFGLETVVYDMGELTLCLGRRNEEHAVDLVQTYAGPLWQDTMNDEKTRKIAWRTVLRVYWESKALGLKELSDAIYYRFLTDDAIHREQLELALLENRELHYEFNDRLMRFAHLSPKAHELAEAFGEAW